MRPEEDRSFSTEPRTIDVEDPERLAAEAARYQVPPAELEEAVAAVGPIRTAVELYLDAPAA